MKIEDMPKLESPFVRVLDNNNNYFVTPEVTGGCEWVFTGGEEVLCTEKLKERDIEREHVNFAERNIVKNQTNLD